MAPGLPFWGRPARAWALAVLCGTGACEHATPPAEPSASPTRASSKASTVGASLPTPTAAELPTSQALAHITPATLRAHVEWLAADERGGRPTPSAQLDEAADYIREQLRTSGLGAPSAFPDHFQRLSCKPGHPGQSSNVLALLPGRDPALAEQTVMITAHYDHIGTALRGQDRIFNGANDNASGTAALMVIAKVLAAAPPRRSVLLIAFCGEEHGLIGSSYYAEHPARPLDSVVGMINLEMLGRPGDADPPTAWLPGMGRSDLSAWLSSANPEGPVRFVDGYEIGPQEGGAFRRSDNFPLAQQGVVAHTVAAGALDQFYHSVDDEADGLDYERMAVVVRAIARGAYWLAESPQRPQWIDPPR